MQVVILRVTTMLCNSPSLAGMLEEYAVFNSSVLRSRRTVDNIQLKYDYIWDNRFSHNKQISKNLILLVYEFWIINYKSRVVWSKFSESKRNWKLHTLILLNVNVLKNLFIVKFHINDGARGINRDSHHCFEHFVYLL